MLNFVGLLAAARSSSELGGGVKLPPDAGSWVGSGAGAGSGSAA